MAKREIDLTYGIGGGMFKHPTDLEVGVDVKHPKLEELSEEAYCGDVTTGLVSVSMISDPGKWRLNFTNHTGTHIDAPRYMIPDGKTISDYPITSKFCNDAVLIDLTPANILGKKYRVISSHELKEVLTPDLKEKCKEAGALILYTGFCDEMAALEGKLSGLEKKKFEASYPPLIPEAAGYIVDELCSDKLNIVGIDSFSVDYEPISTNCMVHLSFLRRDILPLEMLVNLKELRDCAGSNLFKLFSVPLKYASGDAAQTRAYAVVE